MSTSMKYIYIYGLLENLTMLHPFLFYSIHRIILSEEEHKLDPLPDTKPYFLLTLSRDSHHHSKKKSEHMFHACCQNALSVLYTHTGFFLLFLS